ncbi:MAG TPA: response regulator transcription factor [Candidatus Obscuribacterales bacterium]
MAKILLIDDDIELTAVIAGWLASENHLVETVHEGREGLDRLRACQYDVILLDWTLPEMEGIEVLKNYRDEGGSTPVIMLTGKRAVVEKTAGLDTGADDYLTKPFHMDELAARIRSVLRRATKATGNVLKCGDLELDPAKHTVKKAGESIQLLPREFALLEFFMRHPGDVFSSEALLQRVWHSESEATAEAIRTCIKRVRQKLDKDNEESLIETIARIGYRLRVR